MYQSGFPISFDKLNNNKLPKICFLYTLCRPHEKQPKLDVSLQPPLYTIYLPMVFPFEKHLTDNFKYLWTYLFIITYLNITKTFHLIDGKNLPIYAKVASGFWTLPVLILLKMCLLIVQKCSVNSALICYNRCRSLFLECIQYRRLLSSIKGDCSKL